jgi:hypothetical protein
VPETNERILDVSGSRSADDANAMTDATPVSPLADASKISPDFFHISRHRMACDTSLLYAAAIISLASPETMYAVLEELIFISKDI